MRIIPYSSILLLQQLAFSSALAIPFLSPPSSPGSQRIPTCASPCAILMQPASSSRRTHRRFGSLNVCGEHRRWRSLSCWFLAGPARLRRFVRRRPAPSLSSRHLCFKCHAIVRWGPAPRSLVKHPLERINIISCQVAPGNARRFLVNSRPVWRPQSREQGVVRGCMRY